MKNIKCTFNSKNFSFWKKKEKEQGCASAINYSLFPFDFQKLEVFGKKWKSSKKAMGY
jgi:hypothetical protein